MPPVVIRIQENFEGDETFWLDEKLPKAHSWVSLTCRPTESPFLEVRNGTLVPEQVRAAGIRLFENLSQHPVIKARLSASTPHHGAPEPIYLYLEATRAESLPWEALFDPGPLQPGFCALTDRPIGRIVDSEPDSVERLLADPVRMAAVIAAAGVNIDPMPEWEKLEQAINAAGFAIEITVFVARQSLKDHIDQLQKPNVTATFIVDREQLLADITSLAPNVVHFFCHGSAEYGSFLDIATHADDLAQSANGSIKLEGRDFAPQALRASLWLATINACEGAALAPDDEETSLARSLVNNGVPVVVAMRERIDAAVAHVVAECFYSSFFAEIRRLLALPMPAGGGPLKETIEWADVLSGTRRRLTVWRNAALPPAQAAREAKEWTLPALYVRSASPLTLVRERSTLTEEQEGWRGELGQLREYRAAPPPGTAVDVLDQVDDRIEQLAQLLRGGN